MKTVIIAFVSLALVISLVILNSIFISNSIKETIEDLKMTSDSTGAYLIYKSIYEDYMKKQKIFSITVSSDCLREIENDFCELLGAGQADDEESLIIAKSRLIVSLEHIKRLSGVNADSIF